MNDVIVAITGASGSLYAVRLLQVLLAAGRTVRLTLSPAATEVLRQELGIDIDLRQFDATQLLAHEMDPPPVQKEAASGRLVYHHFQDYSAGIASGSFLTEGMVICPCSMGTLAGIANGLSSNLIHRAAEVHLKERRKLIVVPRETPLSSIALENMKRLADAGAIMLPAMPGFYHQPRTIQDLVDFVVGRICDQLGVRHTLTKRWG